MYLLSVIGLCFDMVSHDVIRIGDRVVFVLVVFGDFDALFFICSIVLFKKRGTEKKEKKEKKL